MTGICLCAILPSIKLLYSLAMKTLLAVAAVSLAICAGCDRRPVQKDIPPEHGTMDQTKMEHSEMTSSPGAADAPYEMQFIDTMIVHHQGAVDAAQLVATRAQHKELKQLAKSIISNQQQEIAEMRGLRTAWFGDRPPAINIDLPGMREAMEQMDIEKLDPLKENAFDLEFIRQMIPHHEGAVTMAKDLLAHDANAELKTVAENIIRSQQSEIEQMREWEKQWSK